VSFSYPGTKKTSNALSDISLSIKPGQLVVIVGANGSGKSTIIKLLSRLYEPSSGAFLIDGIPADQYITSDLRRATASFTQDHKLYPLSLYENIGLGDPNQLTNKEMVARAAEQGGAAKFIEKLGQGLQTVLEPNLSLHHINVPQDPEHPLQKKIQMLEKVVDISGGERQRVIAYVGYIGLWESAGRLIGHFFLILQVKDVHAAQF
jgi:ABC-type multidrug transport system fused ATPase/permease subunit